MIELRSDYSPLGEVPVGEIVVVVDERGRRMFTGVYTTRKRGGHLQIRHRYDAGLRHRDSSPVRHDERQ